LRAVVETAHAGGRPEARAARVAGAALWDLDAVVLWAELGLVAHARRVGARAGAAVSDARALGRRCAAALPAGAFHDGHLARRTHWSRRQAHHAAGVAIDLRHAATGDALGRLDTQLLAAIGLAHRVTAARSCLVCWVAHAVAAIREEVAVGRRLALGAGRASVAGCASVAGRASVAGCASVAAGTTAAPRATISAWRCASAAAAASASAAASAAGIAAAATSRSRAPRAAAGRAVR